VSTATAPTPPADAPPAVAPPRRSSGARVVRVLTRAPVAILLVAIGLLWLVPTFGLLMESLLLPSDAASNGWWKILTDPSLASLENYRNVIADDSITSSLWTTLWISIGGTVLPILIGALAAYAFAFLDFPARDWLFVIVVGLLVVPLQMALIPIFSLYNDLGIFDTILSLILFHTAFALPFAIFLLRNFFVGIPRELLEAARIDGASELRIFVRVILPLGLPAIASLAIFQFLWTWNDLLVALTLGRDTQPITVAIFTQLRQFGSNIEIIAPAAFISLAIPLAVFFAFQRYFVQGLLAGSVK
jgi:alpha-glucoside transport system permease protein